MGDKKPLSDQDRIVRLEQLVADQARTISHMQMMGGFGDAKTVGIRCTRIEKRLDLLELDGEMLKDCLAHTNTQIGEHLRDRHDADIDRDDAPDVVPWRRIRRRMREWAEKRGLMTKRKDVSDARRDEGRLRPRREAVPA